MLPFPNPRGIVQAQDDATDLWHWDDCMPTSAPGLNTTMLALHRSNFDLWHLEDAARDPHASDRTIVECKRSIDHTNQQRNDLVEQIDSTLLADLSQNDEAPMHTETPGMILDRLSILSLKLFHTAQESSRTSATPAHRARNSSRCDTLRQQRANLEQALTLLFEDVAEGRRQFKLYRQLKMYNDPTLNPVLYTATHERSLPDA